MALERDIDADLACVIEHVHKHGSLTMKEPEGVLKHKWLVPSGYYQTSCWDWDSMYLGVAMMLTGGSGPYLIGTVKNFLERVDIASGEVKGCLTPAGASSTLYHAKPVLLQMAFLGAQATGQLGELAEFRPQMEALMRYWHTGPRRDSETGLHFWHDIMESGADDLVWDPVPSGHSAEWKAEEQAFTISAPDLMTFLYREHLAFARLLDAWATLGSADAPGCKESAAEQRRLAADIRAATNAHLWHWRDRAIGEGWYCGFDRRTRAQIDCRTYQMAWPLWAGMAESAEHAAAAARAILAPDMRCRWGIRSTSSAHALYSNENRITPYSNWRGPVWINVNVVLAYALHSNGFVEDARILACDVTKLLADDIRRTGSWHENYDSETGLGLASPGFLSWNTLVAELLPNLTEGRDPFAL